MAFVICAPQRLQMIDAYRNRGPTRRAKWSSCAQSKRASPAELREYERYIKKVANTSPPTYLDGLLYVLCTGKAELTPPSNRINLHPFLIPLTIEPDSKVITGLLRWPTPPGEMDLPVVQSVPGDPSLKLLSPSSKLHITRSIASADYSGQYEERDAIRSACSLATSYQDGDVDASNLGLERFLISKGGPFPDIYEGFVDFHRAKGDLQSALVTCERAVETNPGWGRPHAFHAKFLRSIDRGMEARDAARFCLQMPLWTIGSKQAVRDMAILAGYEDPDSLGKIYQRLYKDERKHEIADGKAPEQVALDRAAYLLDTCMTHDTDWETIKENLAGLYEEAKMSDIATFVRY